MRFASVIHQGRPFAVKIDGEHAVPLTDISELGRSTPASLLAAPPLYDKVTFPVSELTYRPVVPNPSKVLCVGLNYLAHIQETQNKEHDYPVLFPKFASSLTGAFQDVPRPPESREVDYEGELAVVIGKLTRHFKPDDDWRQVVRGFTLANDISARDLQKKDAQWTRAKGFDTFCPVGPIVSDEIDFDSGVTIETRLNGELRQQASTRDFIFSLPHLLSFITAAFTLEPGDIILTGTPSGVGPLSSGDLVEVSVAGLGVLRNPVESSAE